MSQQQHHLEAVRCLISDGESYYTEFKGCFCYTPQGAQPREPKEVARDVAEAVVAFANSDGGDLLVGVEDTGSITGVPYEQEVVLFLANAPSDRVQEDPGVEVHDLTIQGNRVLWFRTQASTGAPLVTTDGRCLWRSGKRTEPIPPHQIERRRQHQLGDRGYEMHPVPEASLDDLDAGLITQALSKASMLSMFDPGKLGSVTQMLRYWSLVDTRNGTIVLRRAALLLFAKDPFRWHPNNRIRLRRVLGDQQEYGRELRTRDKQLVGPIARLLKDAIKLLTQELERENKDGALFGTSQLLPREAVEECLVNALAHRNYAVEGSAIEILLYPDRCEFHSPGNLPEPLTVRDLEARKGVHRSRNPLLMRVLRDLGWTRDQGEGMRRIYGAMAGVELNQPQLEEQAGTFIVRLSTQSRYDAATRSWLASYGPYGLKPDERRYLVSLRTAGGSLSVDKLARQLGETYDRTKAAIDGIERKGLVWHAPHSRTFRLVDPLSVPHERALRRFNAAGFEVEPRLLLGKSEIMRLTGGGDDSSLREAARLWQEAGIIVPAEKGRWKLGPSLLEYVRMRYSG